LAVAWCAAVAVNRAVIIGGGAAGYFAAIACAEAAPGHEVVICEGSGEVLSKVRISGGGRCNVTHHCFEARTLSGNYPRGTRELLGPLSHFGPREVVAWFAERGVELKAEADGRMFPLSDDSQTIIDCLRSAAQAAGVRVRLHTGVRAVQRADGRLRLTLADEALDAEAVLLATGSARSGQQLAAQLGHTLVPPVPSLFTFTCPEPWIHALSGVSVPLVQLSLHGLREEIRTEGPLLCTHWGLSGPAVLRASAWGARLLHEAAYRCEVRIDWLAGASADAWCAQQRRDHGAKLPRSTPPAALPRRLWEALLDAGGFTAEVAWAQWPRDQLTRLAQQLNACPIRMTGKGVFKEEFVTAGGVARDEVSWRTMESRRCPGFYCAGECLDVDAITGGFNFQNAWTTGWLAGKAMAQRLCGEAS
jgi:predicted Rossmann fold flavoprotein